MVKRKEVFVIFIKFLLLLLIVTAAVLSVVFTKGRESPKVYSKSGAIVTNGPECVDIGHEIFIQGGSSIDAAISTLICEGICSPQSAGLGGGFLATIYFKESNKIITVDAREIAPIKAHKDMYNGNPQNARSGGLSIAVPGELKGLWDLHKKYGKLKWSEVIQPNIDLCRRGHEVTEYLDNIFKDAEDEIVNQPSLSEVFVDPKTGKPWVRGQLIKRPKLAETLEIIAREGADTLYKVGGSLLKILTEDIKEFGGIIEEEDFIKYEVKWPDPVEVELTEDITLYSNPLPGTGSVLAMVLNIVKKYKLEHDSLSYHRIVEAYKFAYAKRTMLGDDDTEFIRELVGNMTDDSYADEIRLKVNDTTTFQDVKYYGANTTNAEDHGTAHICILAPNGDAIAMTSTINYLMGSKRRSVRTGIILNNEMDDFSTPESGNIYDLPPSPANFIVPGKRPLSSMTPTILINKNGDVQLIIGAAGGSVITTSIAFTIIEHILKGRSLRDSIDARRLHHQLVPMELRYENGFDLEIVDELKNKFNHVVVERPHDKGFSALTAISNRANKIEACFDVRRGGGSLEFSLVRQARTLNTKVIQK